MSGNEVLAFVYALAIGLLLGFEREPPEVSWLPRVVRG